MCVRVCVNVHVSTVKTYRILWMSDDLNRQRNRLLYKDDGDDWEIYRLRTWIPNFPYHLQRVCFMLYSLSLSLFFIHCKPHEWVSVSVILFLFGMFWCVFFSLTVPFYHYRFVWVISAGCVIVCSFWYVASGMRTFLVVY